MSDKNKKFHEFALNSVLFKGRSDWYFCFLKSEKIAQVLFFLTDRAPSDVAEGLHTLCSDALGLPSTIAHFAGGEVELQVVLADLFALLSSVRLAGARGFIVEQNVSVLLEEYETLAQRLAESVHLSPFAYADDFAIPEIEGSATPYPLGPGHRAGLPKPPFVKDIKGQNKAISKGQQERSTTILDFIVANKRVSIKDLVGVVRNCSEKTIQRELGLLIQQGLVQKVGERRWSLYIAAK